MDLLRMFFRVGSEGHAGTTIPSSMASTAIQRKMR